MSTVISGSVNNQVAGTYTLEYSSTPDTQGNTSNTVTRIVNVLTSVIEQENSTSTASSTTQ